MSGTEGWTVNGRPLEWEGARLREPRHTICVHRKPLIEDCEFCEALIPERDFVEVRS